MDIGREDARCLPGLNGPGESRGAMATGVALEPKFALSGGGWLVCGCDFSGVDDRGGPPKVDMKERTRMRH